MSDVTDYQLDEKEWDYLLPVVQSNLNQTPAVSQANKSPMELFTAFHPETPLDVVVVGVNKVGPYRVKSVGQFSVILELLVTHEEREAHTSRVKMYAEVSFEVTEEILEHASEQGIITGHKFAPDVNDFMLVVFGKL
ncbi:hypothetical protein H257_13201 [Aphanomyces astaci]|uniref:Uncharacterized protein n=1 Tax=Aphanomyces astaci TaxID=112090 RepID=W4FY04_APHAT|nr:hypothetical protein H257_13201 [Aphanomyces astaci]ETV71538.1 hypothetical protein H257_13201 [Aphanomyces astaci]|eukprot:XP_009838971.1 hypothetical protein H257_13201 [Aphanomyces astaci]